MPSLKDIRSRIDSTKNTQKITSALKLVSAAKLRRAQQNVVNLRPYAKSLLTLIADIAETQKVDHPLLKNTESPKKSLYLVIASDRGLCGSFNSSISKYTEQIIARKMDQQEHLDFIFVGRRLKDYFSRRSVTPVEYITGLDKDISYELAAGVAEPVKIVESPSHKVNSPVIAGKVLTVTVAVPVKIEVQVPLSTLVKTITLFAVLLASVTTPTPEAFKVIFPTVPFNV